MSYLHTPDTGGYTTAQGKFNQAVMLIGESNEERIKAYRWLTTLPAVQQELMAMNRLPGWNAHDDEVIPGIAENIGPIHRGGRFRDTTQYQFEKLLRALAKLDRAIESETGHELRLPDYFRPKNMRDIDPMISRQLVKRLNDIRRDGEAEQQELKQDPTQITDTLPTFKHVWHWYHKKKKTAKKPK